MARELKKKNVFILAKLRRFFRCPELLCSSKNYSWCTDVSSDETIFVKIIKIKIHFFFIPIKISKLFIFHFDKKQLAYCLIYC